MDKKSARGTLISSMELEKVRQSWENDFLSRPSWCDASLALEFIEAGHADGNVRALKVRLWIQKVLFALGCFIQRNFMLVLVLGIINLATFSLGLLNLQIETNIEKLWVDTYGQLHSEMEHGRRIFFNISNPPDEIYEWYPNFDFTSFSPFVILIQTGKNEGDDVLKPEDLLEHADVLVDIASMQINMFGLNWTLGDVCRKASMIDMKAQPMFKRPAAMLIPCIVITPLDCFWDGAKPLGPFEKIFDAEYVEEIITSTFVGYRYGAPITWKNMDLIDGFEKVKNLVSFFDENAASAIDGIILPFLNKLDIGKGYLDRPCLFPTALECPRRCDVISKVRSSLGLATSKCEERIIGQMPKNLSYLKTPESIKLFGSEPFKPPNVRQILTDGCAGFSKRYLRWPVDLIVGGVERGPDNIMTKAAAYQTIIPLASPIDIHLRAKSLKINLGQNWTKASAEDVLIEWQRALIRFFERKKSELMSAHRYKSMYVITQTASSDLLKKFSNVKLDILFIGYGLMVAYATVSLVSCVDGGVSSSIGLGIAGCILVTLSSMAGLGCSVFLGIPCSVASFQVIPFLTLGLGVDDMFLLVHNYDEIMLQRLPCNEIGILLKETGLAAFFTSFSNIIAFSAGGLMPVPALRDFCLQVALVLFFNAVTILTLYPAIMCIDAKRRKAQRMDLFCCAKLKPKTYDVDADGRPRLNQWQMLCSLRQCVNIGYARCLQNRIVKIVIVVCHIITLIVALIGIKNLKLGLEYTDAVPKNTTVYEFAKARQSYFTYNPFNTVLKGPLKMDELRQRLAKQYRRELVSIPYVVRFGKTRGADPFWFEMMFDWLNQLQSEFDHHWGKTLTHKTKIWPNQTTQVGNLTAAVYAYKLLCNERNRVDCSRIDKAVRLIDSNKIINVEGFNNYLTAWYHLDFMTYTISRANFYPVPPFLNLTLELRGDVRENEKVSAIKPADYLEYSQIHFSLNNLVDTEAVVDMIFQVRNVCNTYTMSGLANYPEGSPFVFWDQYLYLKMTLSAALAIIIVVIFTVISLSLCNTCVGIILVNMMIKLLIELVGFISFCDVQLNAVSSIIIITTLGIGVEFTVHMLISFLTVIARPDHRMRMTLNHMFVPVFNGGISTLLGVIMLAFSEFEFVTKYIFLPLFLLVVLGLWNGLILLPVILSLVGPDSEVDFIYRISNVHDGAVLVDSSKGSVKRSDSKNAL